MISHLLFQTCLKTFLNTCKIWRKPDAVSAKVLVKATKNLAIFNFIQLLISKVPTTAENNALVTTCKTLVILSTSWKISFFLRIFNMI
jgi:hypothetical protein